MIEFKYINIAPSYNTKDSVSIIESFYYPLLENTKIYKRAVAYFSSSSLVQLAKGLDKMIENGGEIRIITSPNLSLEDIEAIKKGYKLREEVFYNSIENSLNDLIKNHFEVANYLAHLIAMNKLEFKIIQISEDTSALYHAKIGIFEDHYGNRVAFSGSNNETLSGILRNYESFDVFKEWENNTDNYRVNEKNNHFDKLWENVDNRFDVYNFDEALKNKLLKIMKIDYVKSTEILYDDYESSSTKAVKTTQTIHFKVPNWFIPYSYQDNAVQSWVDNGYNGLLSMATGSGKTLTSLYGAYKLFNKLGKNSLFIVIVVPYIHLIDQWLEDLKNFGLNPLVASESKNKWYNILNKKIINFELFSSQKNNRVETVIVTNSTFKTEPFQEMILKVKRNNLIIFDEVHNAGSQGFENKLPMNFKYRLGLSATIERNNDEVGTDQIFEYFGNKVFEFTMGQAIEADVLTRYHYYVHFVYLDEEELQEYQDITNVIHKFIRIDTDGKIKLDEKTKLLLIKRSKIIAGAKSKIVKLKELINNQIKIYGEVNKTLIYCGVVSHESSYSEDSERQIDIVNQVLYNEYLLKIKKFTSEESAETRNKIKEEIKNDEINIITAMKCLDEGINIPEIQHAYILSSSTNSREFIQRRGRVLRKFPGKQYAYIHDFFVLPNKLDNLPFLDEEYLKMDSSIIIRELKRVLEFAKYAENSFEVLNDVQSIYNAYKKYLDERGISIYD